MKVESKTLRKLRDSRKLSQQEVADNLGVSQSTYCEWEKKDSNIKLEQLLKLSEFLNVELEELVSDNESVKIFNNYKSQDNSIVGFEVVVDSQKLYLDLLESYKSHISLLERTNLELKEKVDRLELLLGKN